MKNSEQRFTQEVQEEVQEDEQPEEKEKVELRSYESLSPTEKVKAILSEIPQPVSRKFAVELSGVIPEELSENDRNAIDAIFEGEEVERFYDKEMGEDLYRLTIEAAQSLSRNVDSGSVRVQIADVTIKTLFPGEEPKVTLRNEKILQGLGLNARQTQGRKVRETQEKGERGSLLSEEEKQNAERFIIDFIIDNDSLTGVAKAFMQDLARSKRGPWGVRDHVTGVVQERYKIIVHHKSGSANYYPYQRNQ